MAGAKKVLPASGCHAAVEPRTASAEASAAMEAPDRPMDSPPTPNAQRPAPWEGPRAAAEALLAALNASQREAVTHRGGPLMVLAGAGSGKTRVITYRIAHILARGEAQPWNILAVTFTNKAAREMRERIWTLLGRPERDLWVSTFHSACAKILRGHAHLVGYNRDFSIYDDRDQLSLVEECCRDLDVDPERFPPRLLLSRISAAKQQYRSPEEVTAAAGWDPLESRVGAVYGLYQERLRHAQAMDFDDLLFQTLSLWDTHPEVLGHYRQRWVHVLVDEFQDTNRIQYRLVRALAARHRNLCVVGDDDQSIYSWRGADLGNILGFEEDFPDVTLVRLEQNYRSTQRILSASGAVIRRNNLRKGKTLWTQNEVGEPLSLYQAANERDEAAFVADEVKHLVLGEGLRPSDIAVFYRTHAQSRVLEEEFLSRRTAFSIYGGLGFYERREVKDVVAYLRALIHPSDDLSWKRIVNRPRRGIGKTTVEAAEKTAAARGIPFSQALRVLGEEGKRRGPGARVRAFVEMMDGLARAAADLRVRELLEAVLEESGYLADLRRQETLEAQERLGNLQELLNLVAEYGEEEEEGLTGFLERVALVSDIDRLDPEQDRVSLMTLHSAKGLEFPVVFMVGMEERLLPHGSALDDPSELEEERRLCYVGMTRACKRLYLTYAASRRIWGTPQDLAPSRFLLEIPSQCLQALSPGGLPALDDEDPQGSCGVFPGRWVRHPQFGVGRIQRVLEGGTRVVVHFPGVGDKRFVTQEAPLQWV